MLAALLASVFAVSAPPLSIDWYSVDGGGVINATGGTLTLSGTIGQPDAGILGGGKLDGGFWGLIGPNQPILTITHVGPNAQICWPSPSTGFVLQQSSSLMPALWATIATVPTDNGITRCITVPASALAHYYRLSNP
jgi:hypothetical protein